jgi:hypothetical protein
VVCLFRYFAYGTESGFCFRTNQRYPDASRVILLHCESDGFLVARPNCNQSAEHHDSGDGYACSNHDHFGARRTNRNSLLDNAVRHWGNNTLHVEHQLRIFAGRFESFDGRDNLRNPDNGRLFYFHGEGD